VKPDIGSESRFLPTPPALDAPVRGGVPVGILSCRLVREKLEWLGYPMVKKKFEYIFIRFDRMYERDRQTHTHTERDKQTPHGGIGRACIAFHGKNDKKRKFVISETIEDRHIVRMED